MNGQPPGTAWEVGPLTRRVALPPGAEIAVAVGEAVEPATPLAHVPGTAAPVALSLSAELGVGPAQVAEYLTVEAEQTVDAGTVLAERAGLLGLQRRTVTAPQAGRVAFVSRDTGTVVIHPHADAGVVSVPALVYGTVTALEEAPEPAVMLTAPGLAIASAWSYGASAWGPLVVWEEPDPPIVAEDWDAWETAVVFWRGAATADLLIAAARHRAAGIVASGSTELRRGDDPHSTVLEAAPALAVPTLLLYGHLAPTLPAALLEALRPLAGTTVGIAGADRSGAPELLLTGPAAEALAARVGPPVLGPGSNAVILGGRLAGTVVRVIETDGARLFPSEWRGPAARVAAADGSTQWVPLVSLAPLPTVRAE